jgi:hypothetical protein
MSGGAASGASSASLEGLLRARLDRDQLGVQHQPGAGGAVVPALLADVEDALAHLHEARHHPIDRAVGERISAARFGIMRVWCRSGGSASTRRALDGAQLAHVARADRELDEVRHGEDLVPRRGGRQGRSRDTSPALDGSLFQAP